MCSICICESVSVFMFMCVYMVIMWLCAVTVCDAIVCHVTVCGVVAV